MDFYKKIKTALGIDIKCDSIQSPIILALKDIERTNWQMSRKLVMAKIEKDYRELGVTPQQLTIQMRQCDNDKFSRKDKIIMGIWNYLDGDLKAEQEYSEVIKAGAKQVTIPSEIGETGAVTIACCGAGGDKINIEPDIIDLTIYEHNVITCPRCGDVWALRNMACNDKESHNE